MSFVIAAPEFLTAAAMDLASIGSTVSAASAAASAPTVAILAAGADEVSIAVAALFGMHGQAYQALSVQASAFHQQFVQALTAGAYSYASAEAAAVTPLQQLVDVINAPFRSALGRPFHPGEQGGRVSGCAETLAQRDRRKRVPGIRPGDHGDAHRPYPATAPQP